MKKELHKENPVQNDKKLFAEPDLKFIEPKLKEHGDATEITAGFFGSFSPNGGPS